MSEEYFCHFSKGNLEVYKTEKDSEGINIKLVHQQPASLKWSWGLEREIFYIVNKVAGQSALRDPESVIASMITAAIVEELSRGDFSPKP